MNDKSDDLQMKFNCQEKLHGNINRGKSYNTVKQLSITRLYMSKYLDSRCVRASARGLFPDIWCRWWRWRPELARMSELSGAAQIDHRDPRHNAS